MWRPRRLGPSAQEEGKTWAVARLASPWTDKEATMAMVTPMPQTPRPRPEASSWREKGGCGSHQAGVHGAWLGDPRLPTLVSLAKLLSPTRSEGAEVRAPWLVPPSAPLP